MKKIIAGIFIGVLIFGTSCKKYLDINTNPNSATDATPELILPQALTYTGSVINAYNSYGSQIGLYAANAGGFGGFGEAITYNYTTRSTGVWAGSYDNLEDYQAILNKTEGVAGYSYFNAVARIMKAYNFQLLTDAFNNVPYTDALKGGNVLTPTYTDAKVIYKDLADELDKAITTINAVLSSPGITPLGSSDVLFKGDMGLWKKFATTLKLRVQLRARGKVTFSNTTFTEGFLTTDALINPGYTRDNGRQNPLWDTWAFGYTGTSGAKSWMPSQFIFGFYDGHSLTDPARGRATYYQFPNTGTNRLGIESSTLSSSPTGSFWYSGTNRDGTSAGNQVGILKGPNAGMPALLASESYFLQSEAALVGLITTGTPVSLFNSGVQAAFNYTYQLPDKTLAPNVKVADSVSAYMANNSSSYLVNFPLAATDAQKLEAIITQKFIALNFTHGMEAWNEYRRTRYPKVNPSGNGYQTFASSVSESPRADKLPTRILYPTSEASYNSANVPTGLSSFSSLIFWALP